MHPYLLHFGHLALPTYGALAALGLMAALVLSLRTARLAGLAPDAVWDAGLFTMIAAFVLSRLLLVATHPRAFRAYPVLLLAVPSLTATGLLLTGFAAAGWLFWKRLPWLRVLDAWAPCATLVWAFLAVGHFAEGSDPGVPLASHPDRLVPVALLAGAVALILTLLLERMLAGGMAVAWLGLLAAGTVQFVLSFWREPGVNAGLGLDQLQWVALGMILAGALLPVLPGHRLKDETPR